MTDIVKADGEVEPFDRSKLESSLRRSGASMNAVHKVTQMVEKTLSRGVSTQEIYRRAFQLLRRIERSTAARYSIRRAMFELGPSGHPFEDFVAELFRLEGWEVEWRKTIPGKCVSHEVDIYAKRGNEHLAAELKYHNDPGYKTDVKVALYVKARFEDIWRCDPKEAGTCPVDMGYLITNTKFTEMAIQYAKCSGLNLIGWTYPTEGNLYDRIMNSGMYPVTALTMLKQSEKRLLLDKGVVTIEMLKRKREVLRTLNVSPERIGKILAEIETLREPVGFGVE